MTAVLLEGLEIVGIFAFAVTGALVGVRRDLDAFGVTVLALLTGLGGGMIRDVLIGATPPVALREWQPITTALVAAFLVIVWHGRIGRRDPQILVFDALGLGLFCVSGTIIASDAGLAPWDGRWTLVAFSLDEERRPARNVLRELLHAMAAAPLAGGLYAHANDISLEVSRAAAELGVADGLTVARTDALTIGSRSRPTDIAEHLWPLEELAAGYRDFVETFRPHLRRRPADPIDELAMGFEMVAAFRRCSDADPLLPPELLPAKWPGAVARDVLRRFSARLGGARAAAGVPALFSRYDDLFDDLHHPPHVRSR